MINKLTILAVFITASFAFTTKSELFENTPKEEITENSITAGPALSEAEEINLLYEAFSLNNANMPSLTSFSNGILGYTKLEKENKVEKQILTIVDFSLPSTEKRMWVLDMASNKVLFHTYVAHGTNTGGNMATAFSNTPNSLQSSLGFYVTAETYYGRNGLSLFIDGMEKGFNSNARDRYVVIHGADYANPDFIKRNGRLGRSYGCPAVPTALTQDIIDTIKGQSVLFVYHTDENYVKKSRYLNGSQAI